MKIAQIITDDREPQRKYDLEAPFFGVAPEALLEGFRTIPEAEIHIVSCTQRPMKSPARLAGNIYFHSLHVPKIGWLRTAYQGCIRAVRKKLREIRPDIVHAQGTERDQGMSAIFSGFPNVLTIHGNMAALARQFKPRPGSYLWLAGVLEDFTVPRTWGVFCNSVYTEANVKPRNPRTWRVPNSIRRAFFETPLPPRRVADVPRIINVGLVCERKRQLELLRVFRRLHEQGRRCVIEFIGQLPEHSAYEKEFLAALRQGEAAGYAAYSGTMETAELVEAFDRAEGAVHFPSEEAFGLVVAEAMARNLKFFGTRVGGVKDISEGVDGAELFELEDWAGLEGAIARWLETGCPRSKNGAEVMLGRYHPRAIAQRHMEIYREVLASPRRR